MTVLKDSSACLDFSSLNLVAHEEEEEEEESLLLA
jgi:hypothetical protein